MASPFGRRRQEEKPKTTEEVQNPEVAQENPNKNNNEKDKCSLTENADDETFKNLMAAANIWIGDTGTSFHVRGKKANPGRLSENPAPPTLHTALGITTVEQQVKQEQIKNKANEKEESIKIEAPRITGYKISDSITEQKKLLDEVRNSDEMKDIFPDIARA